MKTTKLILTGAAVFSMVLGTVSAADRSYVSGNFMLELDGANAGLIQSVEGGDLAGEVATLASGGDFLPKKHLANVKYDEFTMKINASMGKPVYDWISDTLDNKHPRKDGVIVAADYNYKARERGAFSQALITEVTIPACDGASKDPAYLTVKFSPELVKWAAAADTKPAAVNPRKQKQWLASNFRFNVPGLETARVTKIDAFTIKQTVASESVGETREPQLVPAKLEFPNLRVTVPAGQAESWFKWSEDFIVKGNNGDDQEKEGTLTFLTPDLSEELVRVTFHHMGVSRVHRSLSESKNGVATVTFDLYVEGMEIDFMAQFEK